MDRSRSVLASSLLHSGLAGSDGRRRLRIGERTGWSLVEIEAFAGTSTQFHSAARALLTHPLPSQTNVVVHHGHRCVLRTGCDRYWILARDGEDVAGALEAGLDVQAGSVARLSHSRVCIRIDGEAVPDLLASGIAVDLDPRVFKIDDFMLTGLHHTPVLLHRVGEHSYELLVLTTYAVSVWEWLLDAALPFGFDIMACE